MPIIDLEAYEPRIYLSIVPAYVVPGDWDGNHDVDLEDFLDLKSGQPVDLLEQFAAMKVNWGRWRDRPIIADPAVTNPDYIYTTIEGSLFVDGASASDAVQSYVLPDCGLIAVVAAIADADPEAFTHRIAMLGDGTFIARVTRIDRVDEVFRMTTQLPTDNGQTVYARANGELWVALWEKAMAEARLHAGDYATLAYIWPEAANVAATGDPGESDWVWNYGDLSGYITDRIDDGWAVTLCSQLTDVGPIVANHVYAVTDADAEGARLWNPHGHYLSQTWAQVGQAFRLVTAVTP